MIRIIFLFLFSLVSLFSFSQKNDDLVNRIIQCYDEYYSLLEFGNSGNSKKTEICISEPKNFNEYFQTDFINFSALREGNVATFSFRDSLHAPLKNPMLVTSYYGDRKGKKHFGVDFRLNIGDPVYSVFCGKVRIAKFDEGYGYVVVIRNFNMSESVYAHLSKILVQVGQFVQVGQTIGLGGNTGRSTGPHLHFELRYKGFPINPIVENQFLKKILVRTPDAN